MADEKTKELIEKAEELSANEAMGCGDGFVKASASVMEKRAEAVKTIDPQVVIDKAKALKAADAMGCGDGFTSGVK